MPMALAGSCRCGSVRFTCESHTPVPYQRCYCSICRKTAGGGGYAINLGATSQSLQIHGEQSIGIFRAELKDDAGNCKLSTAERRFCTRCASALWLYSPEWPELIHPFASAVDTKLPTAPSLVHMMLRFAAPWALSQIPDEDDAFDLYPDLSLEDWHREHDVWVP